MKDYLVVGHEDELEHKDNSNDGGPAVMETKAGIDILLLDKESKHGERKQEVELQQEIVQPVSVYRSVEY